MNARGTEITTPNPRAEPPSAVKNVEESRQQRLQRAQSRFRDRGGYVLHSKLRDSCNANSPVIQS